jgi:epoxyqueuosine reductase
MPSNPIFLHSCCGPCACYTTQKLQEDGLAPTLYFYNPNIHPYREQEQRRDALRQLAEHRDLPLVEEPGYDLEGFLIKIAHDPKNRCEQCYRMRLAQAAAKAKESGFTLFGTTLLISPYQNHDLLCAVGKEMATDFKIAFHDEDFRPGFRESQVLAKELGLYRQQYCGCIYSEKERFCKG